MVATHELGDGEYVFLAVGLDAFEVVFLPIHTAYLAAVDVVLGSGDVEDGAEQVQGSEGLIVAELPELHGVDKVGLPRFLACDLQYAWDLYAIDKHAAGDVREVELLAVVGAELGIGCVIIAVQHVGKLREQGFLVVAVERFQAEPVAIEKAY